MTDIFDKLSCCSVSTLTLPWLGTSVTIFSEVALVGVDEIAPAFGSGGLISVGIERDVSPATREVPV